MRANGGAGLRPWLIPSTAMVVAVLVGRSGTWADELAASPPPPPVVPEFAVTKPAMEGKLVLEYSTQVKDHGLGFKFKELKPQKDSEEIDITTTLPNLTAIKITLKFTFSGDWGTVVIKSKDVIIHADAKGKYALKLADATAAAGTRPLDDVPGHLNNAVDAGKKVTLEKCEIIIVPAGDNPDFRTPKPLLVPAELFHIQ
jgi:hypothetical protein